MTNKQNKEGKKKFHLENSYIYIYTDIYIYTVCTHLTSKRQPSTISRDNLQQFQEKCEKKKRIFNKQTKKHDKQTNKQDKEGNKQTGQIKGQYPTRYLE